VFLRANLLFLFLPILVLLSCSAEERGERKPNPYELLYQQIAVDTDDPRLCYKISPVAYLTASWGGEDSEISYLRSKCFYSIAQNTGRAELCGEVMEAKRFLADGSMFSEENCLHSLQSHQPNWVGIYVPPAWLIPILEEVGYSTDTMPEQHRQYLNNGYEEAWLNYYLQDIKRDPAFLEKLLKLPSFEK
jgi:hypothetical protein